MRCDQCSWWSQPAGFEQPPGLGICANPHIGALSRPDGGITDFGDAGLTVSGAPDDAENDSMQIVTAPNFGCVRFEKRKDPPRSR